MTNICHIHDTAENGGDFTEIRKNVCVNDEPLSEFEDGKHYCLFHLPTKDKDVDKFKKIFREQWKALNKKIAKMKNLPKKKQQEEKPKINNLFRKFWFPTKIELGARTFW